MSKRLLSRLRATVAGATFVIAALAGAVLPTVSASALAGPGPSNFTATYNSSTHQIDLTWDALAGANYYDIAMYKDAAHTDYVYADTTGTNPSLTHNSVDGILVGPGSGGGVPTVTPLQNGTTYYFTLQATNSSESPFAWTDASSASATFGGYGQFATMPRNFSVSASGAPTAYWSAPLSTGSTSITGYRITTSLLDGSSADVDTINDASATQRTLRYGPTFTAGQQYKVVVAAINGADGVSPNSAQTTFTYGSSSNGGNSGSTGFTNLPSTISTATISGDSNTKQVGFTQASTPIAEAIFATSGTVDASDVTFGTDATIYKAFAHNLAQKTTNGSFTLFVPYKDGDTAVGICPGADSFDAVKAACPNFYFLTDGQSKNGVTANIITKIDNHKYWAVEGLTGTGGFSTTLAAAQAAAAGVPKTGFSLALANPLMVIAAGVIAAVAVAFVGRKFVRR